MQMVTSSRSKVKGNRTTENEMAAMLGVPPKGFRQAGLDVDRSKWLKPEVATKVLKLGAFIVMNQYAALPLHSKVNRLKEAWAQSKQGKRERYHPQLFS